MLFLLEDEPSGKIVLFSLVFSTQKLRIKKDTAFRLQVLL